MHRLLRRAPLELLDYFPMEWLPALNWNGNPPPLTTDLKVELIKQSWLNLQQAYDLKVAQKAVAKKIEREVQPLHV